MGWSLHATTACLRTCRWRSPVAARRSPLIQTHWPACTQKFASSASHCMGWNSARISDCPLTACVAGAAAPTAWERARTSARLTPELCPPGCHGRRYRGHALGVYHATQPGSGAAAWLLQMPRPAATCVVWMLSTLLIDRARRNPAGQHARAALGALQGRGMVSRCSSADRWVVARGACVGVYALPGRGHPARPTRRVAFERARRPKTGRGPPCTIHAGDQADGLSDSL
jgi:hypothetical protein